MITEYTTTTFENLTLRVSLEYCLLTKLVSVSKANSQDYDSIPSEKGP